MSAKFKHLKTKIKMHDGDVCASNCFSFSNDEEHKLETIKPTVK